MTAMRIVIHTDPMIDGRWHAHVLELGISVYGDSQARAEIAAQVLVLRSLAASLEMAAMTTPLGVVSFERNGYP